MIRGKIAVVLGALLALQAAGAIGGALFVVPNMPIDNLKTGVFTDYTIPAIGLGLIVGGGSLVALTLLVLRSPYAAAVAMAAGLAVIVFELVEVTAMTVTVFTDPREIALWQQPLWFLIGVVIVLLSWMGWDRSRRIGPARHVS